MADARQLKRCLRVHRLRPRRCNRTRRALQRAGSRFANAEHRLARFGSMGKPSGSAGATSASSHDNPLLAPHITVSGQTLQWNRVAGINTYVLVRKVPGQLDHYSVITGTSITPPPVPGATVRYSVRTAVNGSEWAHEVSITYPPVAGQPSGPDTQAAPAITVSGQTLSWNEVGGITTYVFVRKVPGQADQYSEVSGMSVTPAPVPGATVKYSVRTAVTGSAWAPEVAITYPSSPAPPPPPPVTKPVGGEVPAEGSSGMVVGLDIGGWAWASAINDEAGAVKYVRSSYKHFASDSQMELLAKAGVRLMPLFGEEGTLAGYDNAGFFTEIVTWFQRYGKGGTFWQGKPVDLGATTCELINEPGNPYFHSDYSNHALYAGMTKAVHAALEVIPAANRPKLLVSYDGGFNGSQYGKEIFAAGAVADGVTVHPYGGKNNVEQSALGGRERVTQAHEQTGLPVYVTEIGWPTAVGMPATGDSLQWTEAQQAENITRFVKWSRELSYVNAVVYFNYADYGSNDFYGIVHSSGSPHKLSYEALRIAAGN